MKTKILNSFYVLMCVAMIGWVSSCGKDDDSEPKKKTEEKKEEDEQGKEGDKPTKTVEFDKAYAFGELPYLKHVDTKGADEFEKKLAQRQFFFWYKPEERRNIERELRRIGKPELMKQLYDKHEPALKSQPPQHRKDTKRGRRK